MKVVAWFSCGAASAVAAKLASEKYPDLRIVNNPVAEEHEDNQRFLKDVEQWIGVKIETAKNISFPDNSAESVWRKRKFMNGIDGAPCTEQLKKEARRTWEDLNSFDGWHVFGFPVEEKHRHERRIADGMKILPILIDAGLTKQDCFDIITNAGIKLPAVYSMASRFGTGYPNANCIGCVKATSPTYWNHVRETAPEVFEARAVLSFEIGAKLVRCHPKYLPFCRKYSDGLWYDTRTDTCLHKIDKNGKLKLESPRIYLHELPPDARGASMKTMKIECGITCGKY